ncbi:MAG: hypothetical protein OEX97_09780 [Acidimicrobiia bacterium]|nr:hypothetical protein [Acidimicrobiia bacterium]
MTTTTSTSATFELRPVLTGGGLALLWAALGFGTDGTTYHLAPFLVASVPAIIYVLESSAVKMRKVWQLASGGLAASLTVATLLSATGNLAGRSLLPFGGAAFEAVVLAGIGAVAVAGVRVAKQPS